MKQIMGCPRDFDLWAQYGFVSSEPQELNPGATYVWNQEFENNTEYVDRHCRCRKKIRHFNNTDKFLIEEPGMYVVRVAFNASPSGAIIGIENEGNVPKFGMDFNSTVEFLVNIKERNTHIRVKNYSQSSLSTEPVSNDLTVPQATIIIGRVGRN